MTGLTSFGLSSAGTRGAADDLDGVLLRRTGAVYPATAVGVDTEHGVESGTARGLAALEADLAERAHMLSAPLRAALLMLDQTDLAVDGMRLLGRIDALLGADRAHRPLFSGFPGMVPDFAQARFSERIRAVLLAQCHQPCVVCLRMRDIGRLGPCAHVVCTPCLRDGREGDVRCPVCRTPVTGASAAGAGRSRPKKRRGAHRRAATATPDGGPVTLRPLLLGTDRRAGVIAELTTLLARRIPLPPQDRADLRVLIAAAPAAVETWLPRDIPLREGKATVLAALLAREDTRQAATALLPERIDTATDVLRLLWAWSGAEPDLLAPPRLKGLPRPLRRDLLAVLDTLPLDRVAEDMARHRTAWLRAGELLHPYEYVRAFPRAALAFASVRGGAAGAALVAAAETCPETVEVVRTADRPVRIVVRSFASRVEALLADARTDAATALLLTRPGELVRGLHHLLRVHSTWIDDPARPLPAGLLAGLPGALRRVAPGPLLGAWGRLRAARSAGERRVYFPRGRMSFAVGRDDSQEPVPRSVSAPVVALIEAELLRRAGQGPRHDVALLDAGLADLIAPFAERGSSRSLVAVPRGSVQPMPDAGRIRLFLHWMEPRGLPVDLDLSLAFFDEHWGFAGLCDYTGLVFGNRAAVHSGDFTSAPAPRGASEFVDLDLDALSAAGVRHAVMVVFSYNDVPFDALPDAFGGFLDLAAVRKGGAFDPRAVRQRFDLAGDSRVLVPMVLDLSTRQAQWLDLHLGEAGGLHDIARHSERLGRLARDVRTHFAPGGRATVWDLALPSAAARTDEVLVRDRAGDCVSTYRRRAGEGDGAFAARIGAGADPDGRVQAPAADIARRVGTELAGRDVFAALVSGDVPLGGARAPGVRGDARATRGAMYRLYPGVTDTAPAGVTRISAADLTSSFAP